MLIIGCGNRERGDDGAGILVAERLRNLGIEAETRGGEAAELIEAWRGADDVIVVDAVVTGAPVGHGARVGRPAAAGFRRTSASTHGLGVAEAIELAQAFSSPSSAAAGLRNRGTAIRSRSRDLSRSTACYRGRGAQNRCPLDA